jgi:hypothetical protein
MFWVYHQGAVPPGSAIMNVRFDDIEETFAEDNPEIRHFLGQGSVGLDADHTMAQNAANADAVAQDIFCGNCKNFLLWNPLSSQWTLDNIKANPASLPFLYIAGMVGYAISLPIRIMIFVVTLFKIISTFFECLFTGNFSSMGSKLKLRSLIFLGASGELVSGALGVVCPVAAYKVDERVQTNPKIHSWYSSNFLSFWLYEINGRQVTGGEVGLGGETLSVGNEHRMQLLKVELEEYDDYFLNAKEELKGYLTEDEIDGMTGSALYQITDLGFLLAIAEGKSLNLFKEKALDKCATQPEKDKKGRELEAELRKIESYWKASVDCKEAASRLARIPLVGRFFKDKNQKDQAQGEPSKIGKKKLVESIKKELLLSEDDDIFEGGAAKKAKLKEDLEKLEKFSVSIEGKRITIREAVKELAEAIRKFSTDVRTTNREVETTVMKAAYPS